MLKYLNTVITWLMKDFYVGLLYIQVMLLFLYIMNASIKYSFKIGVLVYQYLQFRNIFHGAIAYLHICYFKRKFGDLSKQHYLFLIVRGFFSFITSVFSGLALQYINISEMMIISSLKPILVSVSIFLIYRERITCI
jgi:drug/metabolite transporter (DMT)-like permease